MSTPRRSRSKRLAPLVVDERTKDMTTEALVCRGGLNHAWIEIPQAEDDARSNRLLGIAEIKAVCHGGCGGMWVRQWSTLTEPWLLIKNKRDYGANYLVPKGTGRLPKHEARKAYFARKFPGVY